MSNIKPKIKLRPLCVSSNKIKLRPLCVSSNKIIKYIDLFCGIGGFRQAIENFNNKQNKYQFKCVLSCDIKQDALNVYNLNFKENNVPLDIQSIKSIGEFDLLCAGFPCQPWSSAGSRQGFMDRRGNMIYNIIDICQKYHPSTIILENVPNLETINGGKTLELILNEFKTIGYNLDYKIINSKDFGIPQDRKRLFIVGQLNTHMIDFDLLIPRPTIFLNNIIEYDKTTTNIPQILYKQLIDLNTTRPIEGCSLKDKRGGLMNINSWDLSLNGSLSEEQKDLMRKIMTERRKKHWAEKKQIIWMDGMPLTLSEIETFCAIDKPQLMLILDDLVNKKYLKIEKPKDLINNKRIYKDDAEAGYNICKGKLSFPLSQILDKNSIAPTLTATDSCKLVIHFDKCIRYLTPTEMKRICGFPDNYLVPDNANYCDLFGNMVCPPVVEAILDIIYV